MQDTTMHTIMLCVLLVQYYSNLCLCMCQDKALDLCSLLCVLYALLVPFFQMLPPLKLSIPLFKIGLNVYFGVYNSVSFHA